MLQQIIKLFFLISKPSLCTRWMEEQRERLICVLKRAQFPTVQHLWSPTSRAHWQQEEILTPSKRASAGRDRWWQPGGPASPCRGQPALAWGTALPSRWSSPPWWSWTGAREDRALSLKHRVHRQSAPTSKNIPRASLGNLKGVHVLQELWSKLCRIKSILLPPKFRL